MILPSDKKKLVQLCSMARSAKHLNIEDDKSAACDWRRKLAAHGAGLKDGVPSLTLMNVAQLQALLKELIVAGFRYGGRAAGEKVAPWRLKYINKLRAQWAVLHQAGIVRDGSMQALRAWAKRQYQLDALEWQPDEPDYHKLITALNAWGEREGLVIRKYADGRTTMEQAS